MISSGNECFVKVENVSKKFCRSLGRSIFYGLIDLLLTSFDIRSNRSKLRKSEFWAVDNVSLELKKGDRLGIIGTNGSGKSTLLRMIAGIYEPDKGDVYIKGKVVSFLAPGTGFHPHLTVEENIYINGALLSMTRKEIAQEMDKILSFTELKESIDTPLGVLSPGMSMRLSIAVALMSKPDIFIMDEVLAVGDPKFRKKCFDYLIKISTEIIIIQVSHNMEMIEWLSTRLMTLSKGENATAEKDMNLEIANYVNPV